MPKSNLERIVEGGGMERSSPEGHLPYVTEITESMKDYAKLHLNETPERRVQCLDELRMRLSQETDLDSRTDEAYLLCVLRARKFDVDRAFALIKMYYSFLDTHRHVFINENPAAVRQFSESKFISFLPYRDINNRAIVICRSEAWDPNSFPPIDAITGGLVVLRSAIVMPANQIMGFTGIVDFKNLSFKQVLLLVPKYARMFAQGVQYCCPGRVGAIHVLNIPDIVWIVYKIVKVLISEKIHSRIIFHRGKGYDSLHEHVPKAILPSELGGDLGPVCNDHWIKVKDLATLQNEYNEEIKHGFKNSKNMTSPLKQKS